VLLPLATQPFAAPTDRHMLPSERREFVRTTAPASMATDAITTARPCRSFTTSANTRSSSRCVLVAEMRSARRCGSDTVSTRCGRPDPTPGD
jgi:hypothetical protein